MASVVGAPSKCADPIARRLDSELMKEQDQEHDQAKDAKESFSTVPTAVAEVAPAAEIR